MPDSFFYLGRWADDKQPVQYDPVDLTTHAVMIGMTGSGKTGLLIALLEEAARQGLPAIIIDPKGDLSNLLLHFPALRPEDFAPWIDPEEARRANTSVADAAAATAERWRKGLADGGLGTEELSRLRDAVDYTIFTPGSTAGMPVNLLSSFAAPANWEADKEAQRERIASTVTALLGLVGMDDVDPLRSREHILLSNIFEQAWSQGKSLDLAGLIELVQSPPFDRLGAFPLERFFPEKDRFELALLLNNFLAAPSFQTWLEGQPLDAARLLFSPEGKPQFSIFYLAHLTENERMFFVTLLLAAVESWMRVQRGTSGLRTLLAFDEIVGYLPPVANPPSRPVLLRLIKQGRAFGLGLALATQNPTDLNYKALSNAGTWFIGRLQTERDKDRLLDGLQSLDSAIDRATFDQMIAGLRQRLFLLHNVHQPGPRIFESRWDLNYLAGPLTRAQLPALKKVGSVSVDWSTRDSLIRDSSIRNTETPFAQNVGTDQRITNNVSTNQPITNNVLTNHESTNNLSPTRPALPSGISEYYLPAALSVQRALAVRGGALRGPLEPQGLVYKPALLAQAEMRYFNRRYALDYTFRLACLVPEPAALPDWDVFSRPLFNPDQLAAPDASTLSAARFRPLPGSLSSARGFSALQRDFLDWAYRKGTVYVRANEALKVYAAPDVPEEEFRRQVGEAVREGMQAEIDKTAAAYDQKLEALRQKIEKQQMVVDRRQDSVDDRKAEQTSTDLELLASVFTRRKRSLATSLSKRRMTQQAQGEFDEARKVLADLEAAWKALAAERQTALQRIQADWQERAAQVSQVPVTPMKKDIYTALFGVTWLPYYLVKNPDGVIELPAF